MSHQSTNPLWLCRAGGHGRDRGHVDVVHTRILQASSALHPGWRQELHTKSGRITETTPLPPNSHPSGRLKLRSTREADHRHHVGTTVHALRLATKAEKSSARAPPRRRCRHKHRTHVATRALSPTARASPKHILRRRHCTQLGDENSSVSGDQKARTHHDPLPHPNADESVTAGKKMGTTSSSSRSDVCTTTETTSITTLAASTTAAADARGEKQKRLVLDPDASCADTRPTAVV